MAKRTVIPFGPQHPVLPEPVHLDLVLEDETVVEAIPSIGYIHRGLEKLVEKREWPEMVSVIERICGICSFGHGMGYCLSIEGNMGIQIPERAEYLRLIWHELGRVHSHLLWLGLLADSFGFESLYMHTWKLRETVLDLFERTTGGRVIFSVCKVGGLRRDVDADTLALMERKLTELVPEIEELAKVFIEDSSVGSRLKGVGVLTAEEAAALGAVGPVARGSGLRMDVRLEEKDRLYVDLGFEPCVETAGDSHARCVVRIRELFQSIELIKAAIQRIPDGEVSVPVKGNPEREYIARVEQPRGEAYYYSKGAGEKFLKRIRVRTPTNANIPAMVKTLAGAQLADVPILILTIDPCISCTER
ncbi:MAG: nickel-dependent hydrogenase large subunit [Clostridiales Family XIII bacterium]|jgi:ech hydrogenase subunit E|nr:nickel-dependent hydrogenase large subunit [Clostridiales Family XIII bacterium]